jgi:hypothetical protein
MLAICIHSLWVSLLGISVRAKETWYDGISIAFCLRYQIESNDSSSEIGLSKHVSSIIYVLAYTLNSAFSTKQKNIHQYQAGM